MLHAPHTYLISLTLRWLEFKHADSVSVSNAGMESPPTCWLELQAGISQAGWRVVSLNPQLQGKQYIAGVERKLKTKVEMINYPLELGLSTNQHNISSFIRTTTSENTDELIPFIP